MSAIKLICVASTLAALSIASSAFADCSRSQEVDLAKQATRAVSDKVGGDQHHKQIILRDCDASGDVTHASFVYSYLNDQGVQTLTGSVEAANGQVTALNMANTDRRVASRDERNYDETYEGRFPYRE